MSGVVPQEGLGRPQPFLRTDQQEGQLNQDRRREDDGQDFFAQHGSLSRGCSVYPLVPKLRLGTRLAPSFALPKHSLGHKGVPKCNLGTRGKTAVPALHCLLVAQAFQPVHRCGGRGRPPYHLTPDSLTPGPCCSNLPVVPVFIVLIIVIKGPDLI